MTAAQFNQLLTIIRGVATKVHAAQRNINTRLDAMDRQITDIRAEIRIMRVTSSPQPAAAPAFQGKFQDGLPTQLMLPPQRVTSVPFVCTGAAKKQNSEYLPWALESIAFALQQIKENRVPQFCACGKPKGLPDSFRARHFDWCFNHSQQMLPGQVPMCAVGQNPRECRMVHWENMSTKAWVKSVAEAKMNGSGSRGVKGLDRVLFPDHWGRGMVEEIYLAHIKHQLGMEEHLSSGG